jgi:hypothetical protein
MHDKAKDLFAGFKAGQVSRRELMGGAAKLGISAAAANFMLNALQPKPWRPISTGRSSLARNFTFS